MGMSHIFMDKDEEREAKAQLMACLWLLSKLAGEPGGEHRGQAAWVRGKI